MKRTGLTLVELMITIAISAIVLTGMVTFYSMASKNWTLEQLKSLMQQQVEVGIERMKREMMMSTSNSNEMVFYGDPSTDNPPYEAISFPLPAYSDSELRIIDRTGGTINWGTTVVYHVYTDTQTNVTELRRTVFNNRAHLTKEQREAQLATVVADGDGSSASAASEATITETVFTNLVSLEIEGSAKFDGYDPSADGIKSNNVGFGSALLTPGSHSVKFQVIGKNNASSSYGLGIDYIMLSPSGSAKEGEDYYSTAVYGGGTFENPEDMYNNTNAVWSGNYHQEFSGTAVSSYISIPVYYDEWRETNFDNGNILWDYTQKDSTAQHDYIARLEGNDTAWRASEQTGADKADAQEAHTDQYIRIVISKSCLSYSGSAAKIKISSHSGHPLKITSAYFGVRDGETPNFTGTPVQLTFGASSSAEILIPSGSSVQSNWFQLASGGIPPAINKNADPKTDYLVSFHIDSNLDNANCSAWGSSEGTAVNSYIRTAGSGPNPLTDVWIVPASSKDIFAVEDIFVSYVSQGACTSQIYNTSVDNGDYPHFRTLTNSSSVPQDTTVFLEARASDNDDMSGATGWSNNPLTMNSKQYVQFRAALASTQFPYLSTPEVKSVYMNWDPTAGAEKRLVDVSGYFTMRPDYGIFKILIDDKDLIRGITVTMRIEENVLSNGYTSQLTTEVYPRNTGK